MMQGRTGRDRTAGGIGLPFVPSASDLVAAEEFWGGSSATAYTRPMTSEEAGQEPHAEAEPADAPGSLEAGVVAPVGGAGVAEPAELHAATRAPAVMSNAAVLPSWCRITGSPSVRRGGQVSASRHVVFLD